MKRKIFERYFERHVAHQRDELFRDADQRHAFGIGQGLAKFRLFDFGCASKQGFEIVIFDDKLGRRLGAYDGDSTSDTSRTSSGNVIEDANWEM